MPRLNITKMPKTRPRAPAITPQTQAPGASVEASEPTAPGEVTTIDHAIPRKEGGPRVPATTSVWLLATAACEPRSASLVCARPHTGRLHQIRRHLKHAGHPLLGDGSYGRGDLNRAFAERHGLSRLALHARWFRFRNPVTGALVAGEAPMPDDLAAPMRSMALEDRGFAPHFDPLA